MVEVRSDFKCWMLRCNSDFEGLLIQMVTDYAAVSFEKMTGILLFFLLFLYEIEEMFVWLICVVDNENRTVSHNNDDTSLKNSHIHR
jgi:hypothetical protein